MSNWTDAELSKISARTISMSLLSERMVTSYGTATCVWSVVVDNSLYARGYNGRSSSWYQPAVTQKARRVRITP